VQLFFKKKLPGSLPGSTKTPFLREKMIASGYFLMFVIPAPDDHFFLHFTGSRLPGRRRNPFFITPENDHIPVPMTMQRLIIQVEDDPFSSFLFNDL
jgi:hypothetical protein